MIEQLRNPIADVRGGVGRIYQVLADWQAYRYSKHSHGSVAGTLAELRYVGSNIYMSTYNFTCRKKDAAL